MSERLRSGTRQTIERGRLLAGDIPIFAGVMLLSQLGAAIKIAELLIIRHYLPSLREICSTFVVYGICALAPAVALQGLVNVLGDLSRKKSVQ